jgi:hypothetical protein
MVSESEVLAKGREKKRILNGQMKSPRVHMKKDEESRQATGDERRSRKRKGKKGLMSKCNSKLPQDTLVFIGSRGVFWPRWTCGIAWTTA